MYFPVRCPEMIAQAAARPSLSICRIAAAESSGLQLQAERRFYYLYINILELT
jgi:hypothetical protein